MRSPTFTGAAWAGAATSASATSGGKQHFHGASFQKQQASAFATEARGRFHGEVEIALGVVGVDRHSMPFDGVGPRAASFLPTLTTITLLSPGATLALPTGSAPPGPESATPENFGSTPSEKVMRISDGRKPCRRPAVWRFRAKHERRRHAATKRDRAGE